MVQHQSNSQLMEATLLQELHSLTMGMFQVITILPTLMTIGLQNWIHWVIYYGRNLMEAQVLTNALLLLLQVMEDIWLLEVPIQTMEMFLEITEPSTTMETQFLHVIIGFSR